MNLVIFGCRTTCAYSNVWLGRAGTLEDLRLALKLVGIDLTNPCTLSHEETQKLSPMTEASENIAYQYSSTGLTTAELAEAFFEGWKQSAEHRKNMLDADATETGLAVAQSDQTSYYYAVQMFGRPSSQRIEFQIVNRSAAAISYEIGGRPFTLPPQYTRTHQQCRPAALRFRWPDRPQTPPKQPSQTIHPKDGERYTIIHSEAGPFIVERE